MRAAHNIVVNLLLILLAEGTLPAPTEFKSVGHEHGSFRPQEQSEEFPRRQLSKRSLNLDNIELVRKLVKKWGVGSDKVTKYSDVAAQEPNSEGNGVAVTVGTTQQNQEKLKQADSASNVMDIPHLLADYGVLGTSDSEDSAKWGTEEIKNATQMVKDKGQGTNGKNHLKDVTQDSATVTNQTSLSSVLGSDVKNDNASEHVDVLPVKSQDVMVSQTKEAPLTTQTNVDLWDNTTARNKSSIESQSKHLDQSATVATVANVTSANGSQLNDGTKQVGKDLELQAQNTTMPTTLASVKAVNEFGHNNGTTNFDMTVLPNKSQEAVQSVKTANRSMFVVTMPKIAVTEEQLNTLKLLSPPGSESNISATIPINITVKSQPLQATQATDKERPSPQRLLNEPDHHSQGDEAALAVNVTSLREGQSFDLQMPSSTMLDGSFDDNHFHLSPNEPVKSSEQLPKELDGSSSSSFFLNETLDKVATEEQANTRQPNLLLEKLNSELISSPAGQLGYKGRPNTEGMDETFDRDREETPSGRTFTANYVESNNNDAVPGRQPNPSQGREEQQEIQQDESLARALNDSSASSIIFSANQAILDTDNAEFSKKSTQGRLNSKRLNRRSERTSTLHHLTERYRKTNANSKISRHHGHRAPKTSQEKGTRRQVIDIGSHLLWFGGQGAADANGFPRHKTGAEASQYSPGAETNVDNPNFVNAGTGGNDHVTNTSKGFKNLEHALSSMESNPEGPSGFDPSDPSFQYGMPANQGQHGTNQGTNVLIQDDSGKQVYQGVVNIVKFNATNSNESQTNDARNQSSLQINTMESQNDGSSGESALTKGVKNIENDSSNTQTEITTLMNNTITKTQDEEPSKNITLTQDTQQNANLNGNQTLKDIAEALVAQIKSANTTVHEEKGDQKQTKEMQHTQQAQDQHQLPNQHTTQTEQQQSMQEQSKDQSQTQSPEEPLLNGHQPSAFIKKVGKNDGEPETYHVILNDQGKKITNANGHVTVVISGPTAPQASMVGENTLLIPQANSPALPQENESISPTENLSDALNDNSDFMKQSGLLPQTAPKESKSVDLEMQETTNDRLPNSGVGQTTNATNQAGGLASVQENKPSGSKTPLEIEGKVNNEDYRTAQGQTSPPPQVAAISHNTSLNSQSPEVLMQQGHNFVKVGQDLTEGAEGLQMQEVSRPDINPSIREEDKLLQGLGAENLEQGETSIPGQAAQDVPTLNLVLNPTHRLDGSLSVGDKVIPLMSAKGGSNYLHTPTKKQQLDCHAQPTKGQTKVTVLTCQKKQYLANNPQAFNPQQRPFGTGRGYFGGTPVPTGRVSQLDQVMNLLNDQVKTTINKEMKTESHDIENILTGMDVPSTSLMDSEEAERESEQSEPSQPSESSLSSEPPEPPESSESARRTSPNNADESFTSPSPINADESFTSPTDFGRPEPWIPPRHYRPHRHHFVMPHYQHPWAPSMHHHRRPMTIMAHQDKEEGFWDYAHNIWIPRDFAQEEDRDHEGDRREDHREEDSDNREGHWAPWPHHGHRRGNWVMAHPPWLAQRHHFSPFRPQDLFHLRLPTLFGRSGPWKPPHHIKPTPQGSHQELGAKRTAVVHKALRGDRDMCRPIIEGPSPPLKGEWEYLGKVLCSCRGGLSDSEW